MIVPSKITPFENSIIYKMLSILEHHKDEIGILDFYHEIEDNFSGIEEYIYSLDVLFVLDYITIDFEEGVLNYVKRNNL